ncbi:MAG: hypothetical protein ACOC9N_02065 [Gemmatimonadota bacterium]
MEGAGSSKLGQRRIDIEIGLNVYNLTNGDDLLPESVVGNRVLPVCGEALAASHKRQAELMIRMRY